MRRVFSAEVQAKIDSEFPPRPELSRAQQLMIGSLSTDMCRAERLGDKAEASRLARLMLDIYDRAGVPVPERGKYLEAHR